MVKIRILKSSSTASKVVSLVANAPLPDRRMGNFMLIGVATTLISELQQLNDVRNDKDYPPMNPLDDLTTSSSGVMKPLDLPLAKISF